MYDAPSPSKSATPPGVFNRFFHLTNWVHIKWKMSNYIYTYIYIFVYIYKYIYKHVYSMHILHSVYCTHIITKRCVKYFPFAKGKTPTFQVSASGCLMLVDLLFQSLDPRRVRVQHET